MNNNAIMQTVPAASALHKVPGFNPLKYLKRTTNAEGEPVLWLGLDYKKLWFRLACPNGRMLLNPLRITDQMALIEAKVFFDRGDSTPASSFTATRTAKESRSYIRDAQNEALNVALDNAGFGIQLCDVAGVSGSQSGPEVPVSRVETPPVQTAPPAQADTAPVERAKPAAVTEQPKQEAQIVVQQEQPRQAPIQETPADTSNEQTAATAAVTETRQPAPAPEQKTREAETPAAENEPNPQPEAQKTNLHEVVDFFAQMAKHNAQPDEAPAQETPAAASAAPAYSTDMPVEEICKVMTLEEARAVVVPVGTCKGWTLAQVVEQRLPSLKFFVHSQGRVDNVVKAAATLLWNDLELKKAG